MFSPLLCCSLIFFLALLTSLLLTASIRWFLSKDDYKDDNVEKWLEREGETVIKEMRGVLSALGTDVNTEQTPGLEKKIKKYREKQKELQNKKGGRKQGKQAEKEKETREEAEEGEEGEEGVVSGEEESSEHEEDQESKEKEEEKEAPQQTRKRRRLRQASPQL